MQVEQYMRELIEFELNCEIEYEKGCGIVMCETPAQTLAVTLLQLEMGFRIDMNASEIKNNYTGYLWIYRD